MYVFSYRLTVKKPKYMVTEKEEKHKPGKILLSYLPGVCDYLFFYGEKTKPLFVNCYTFYIRIKIYKRGWSSLLIYFLSVHLLFSRHRKKNKVRLLIIGGSIRGTEKLRSIHLHSTSINISLSLFPLSLAPPLFWYFSWYCCRLSF